MVLGAALMITFLYTRAYNMIISNDLEYVYNGLKLKKNIKITPGLGKRKHSGWPGSFLQNLSKLQMTSGVSFSYNLKIVFRFKFKMIFNNKTKTNVFLFYPFIMTAPNCLTKF
jgi:hypothetical protein